MERCEWCLDGGILQKYHDEEWGNLLHDDKKHFEYLLMEVMQCGLNWTMMLKKREIFRQCFDDYIWSFSEHHTFVYVKHQQGNNEVRNELSDKLSHDMKKRGFKYLGSITIFSHLQACGIINDHACNCFKYEKLLREGNVRYI